MNISNVYSVLQKKYTPEIHTNMRNRFLPGLQDAVSIDIFLYRKHMPVLNEITARFRLATYLHDPKPKGENKWNHKTIFIDPGIQDT
jgi:hypothetical protein